MTQNTVSPEIAMCGVESKMSPGKFCKREKHPDTALHIFSGLPHEGGSSLDQSPSTEAEHGDFVSMLVPTEPLRALQEAWERLDDDQMRTESVRLIRDLFDGADGHLHAIDAVLGPRG